MSKTSQPARSFDQNVTRVCSILAIILSLLSFAINLGIIHLY